MELNGRDQWLDLQHRGSPSGNITKVGSQNWPGILSLGKNSPAVRFRFTFPDTVNTAGSSPFLQNEAGSFPKEPIPAWLKATAEEVDRAFRSVYPKGERRGVGKF